MKKQVSRSYLTYALNLYYLLGISIIEFHKSCEIVLIIINASIFTI